MPHLTAECALIFTAGTAGFTTVLMLFLLTKVSAPKESSPKKPAIFVDS